MKLLRHPFWQAVIVMVVAWIVVKFGIPYVPPLLGVHSAPVPNSVLIEYLAIVLVAMLLYVSADENRWREFKAPINAAMVQPERKPVRLALLVLIPVLVGWITFGRVRPNVAAPPSLRSIHPAPPNQISFRGKQMNLAGLQNPLRSQGDLQQHVEDGKVVYYQNCLPCHGDALDGNGHFAHGFSPTPANFRDNGTIAQLTESFVFWRIAKGGVGLPREGTPWNSAMPAWEDFLTEDQIWSVIIFLYEQAGWQPRAQESHEAAGEGG
jgi:mono/diheme cytochrome c family protein